MNIFVFIKRKAFCSIYITIVDALKNMAFLGHTVLSTKKYEKYFGDMKREKVTA
jgi:hypothetical protein